MIFIDTNYFVRFFLHDNDDQFIIAKKIFEDGASGRVDLFSSTIVFFEIYWLFKSYYKKPDQEIYKILKNVLRMKFIDFTEREVLKKALEIYKTSSIGMEDSYNLAYSKSNEATDFKTFDKDLLKEFTLLH